MLILQPSALSRGTGETMHACPDVQRFKHQNRVILTSALAVEIYLLKYVEIKEPWQFANNGCKTRGGSSIIAARYGVSPKAIRDIWNHKSWAKATCHFWDRGTIRVESPPEDPDI